MILISGSALTRFQPDKASPVLSARMTKPAFEDPFPTFDKYEPIDREVPGEGCGRERRGSLASILTVSGHIEENMSGSTARLLISIF
jgi:hypothetical protein